MMCNYKKNGAALADARFFQMLHLQSESATAVKVIQAKALRNRVNTGQSGGTIGRHRAKILTAPQRTGFQPLPIAVKRSMDIRRSPLSFDGYTATTPAVVTLSDFYITLKFPFDSLLISGSTISAKQLKSLHNFN